MGKLHAKNHLNCLPLKLQSIKYGLHVLILSQRIHFLSNWSNWPSSQQVVVYLRKLKVVIIIIPMDYEHSSREKNPNRYSDIYFFPTIFRPKIFANCELEQYFVLTNLWIISIANCFHMAFNELLQANFIFSGKNQLVWEVCWISIYHISAFTKMATPNWNSSENETLSIVSIRIHPPVNEYLTTMNIDRE